MQIHTQSKYDYLLPAALLAAAAGGLDAYTYLEHGEVFAGLQTGNLILLGTHLGQGQSATRYLISIMMFMVGTLIVRLLQHRYPSDANLSRSTIVIFYEILLIGLSGGLSAHVSDIVTTGLLSMAAAGQLQEFRRLNGGPFTSLMMTGNIRTLAESLYDAAFKHDHQASVKGLATLTIIISFVLGAGFNGVMVTYWGDTTIWISAIILFITWLSSHVYRIIPSSH
ncbi:YoaK family protein [Secundilactobacillus kimchicus]|uniref:DUF1275 domain-containing protein n=1 Tax=Secundilactobacillus kimchicus JCM 15530 TaxID=1302272 RepID=A0A0R1HNP8_9LACO|nr:YoaK family protein [Secundilactobacillus kimchicus]KRK48461.1 hypothetical protein FC96_GL001567 [Secundilactobacillus kimchicus JCM 15530]